jgi:type III pantothenate kinase
MNLIVDIGNTVAKIAVFEGKEMLEQAYDSNESLSRLKGIYDCYLPKYAAVVSVVDLTEEVKRVLGELPIPILYIDANTPLPIRNLYETPQTLGYDRIAAVTGAYGLFPGNDILVIDSGTCITYEFISAKGEYRGGNISLGATMRFKALHSLTGHLPLVNMQGRRTDFGVDTDTAIREGVLRGIEYEMEGYIRTMQSKYPHLLVFLTGGKHFDFESKFGDSIHTDKFLVLKGINDILNYNLSLRKRDNDKK